MKCAYCVHCGDLVTPHRMWRTDRSWRWCECQRTGTRWHDGDRGLLQVTSATGKAAIRVLSLNNAFLEPAVRQQFYGSHAEQNEEWRLLHDMVAENTPANYLFAERRRHCWAVIIRPGETGDIAFVDYTAARGDSHTSPGSSTDRAAAS